MATTVQGLRGAARGFRGDGHPSRDPPHVAPPRPSKPQATARLITFETGCKIMKRISGLFHFAARRRDPVRDQSGNAAIEMALLATPVFLFVFAIVNAGRVMWLQNALDTSVTQAARCASVNPSLCG